MTDARYTVYIDKAYSNYVNKCNEDKWMREIILDLPFPNKSYGLYSQEEFINKIKTDTEFSEKWGLKIEERELSLEERIIFAGYDYENRGGIGWNMLKESVDLDNSIPRKLITITYNDKKIESYE
jgi:hypothetical protein